LSNSGNDQRQVSRTGRDGAGMAAPERLEDPMRAPLALTALLVACGDKSGDDTGTPDDTASDVALTGDWTLTCTTAEAAAPYAVGDTETFDVAADGTLTVDGAVTWELSDIATGTFNEFNLYDASGAFLAQFTEEGGGDDGDGGVETFVLEATGGTTSGSTPRPYAQGETTTLTWDGAEAITTDDATYGALTPTFTGAVTLEGADAAQYVAGYGFTADVTMPDGSSSRFDYVVKVSENTTAAYGLGEVSVQNTPIGGDGSEGLPSSSQMRPQ
jgi:hypothetical protein